MKIKCIKDVVMEGSGDIAFIKGKTYEIIIDNKGIGRAKRNEQGSSCHIIKRNVEGATFFNEHFIEFEKVETNYETRLTAILLIDKERNRQDSKWGEQNHPPEKWTSILGEEYGEYCQAVNETVFNNADKKHLGGYENMMKELTHVAAVAVGAMECLMRNKEKWGI